LSQENLLGSIPNEEADSSDSEIEEGADSDDDNDENFISLEGAKDDDEENENADDSDDESVEYEDVSSGNEEEVEEDSDSDFVNDKSDENYATSDEEEEEKEKTAVVPKTAEPKPPKQKKDKKNKPSTSTATKDTPTALAALNNELDKAMGVLSVKKDEFDDGDTSDEEDIRNTVGNIPMHWYDEYKHIGYDWDAKKIIKPPVKDAIDNFLNQMEDPNFWRTVKDPQTGQDVILTKEDIGLIKRIMSQKNPDQNFEDYAVSSVKYLTLTYNILIF
jgi:ribosome biogenesis protein ERB1